MKKKAIRYVSVFTFFLSFLSLPIFSGFLPPIGGDSNTVAKPLPPKETNSASGGLPSLFGPVSADGKPIPSLSNKPMDERSFNLEVGPLTPLEMQATSGETQQALRYGEGGEHQPLSLFVGLGRGYFYPVTNKLKTDVQLSGIQPSNMREIYVDNLGCSLDSNLNDLRTFVKIGHNEMLKCKVFLTPGSVYHPGGGGRSLKAPPPLTQITPANESGQYGNISLRQFFFDKKLVPRESWQQTLVASIPWVPVIIDPSASVDKKKGPYKNALTQGQHLDVPGFVTLGQLYIYTLEAFPDYVQADTGHGLEAQKTITGRFLIQADAKNTVTSALLDSQGRPNYCHKGKALIGSILTTDEESADCHQSVLPMTKEPVGDIPSCAGKTLAPGKSCIDQFSLTLKWDKNATDPSYYVIGIGTGDNPHARTAVASVVALPSAKANALNAQEEGLPSEITVGENDTYNAKGTVTLSLNDQVNPPYRSKYIAKVRLANRSGNFVITDTDCEGKTLVSAGTYAYAGQVRSCQVHVSFKTDGQTNGRMIVRPDGKVHYTNSIVLFSGNEDGNAHPALNKDIIGMSPEIDIHATKSSLPHVTRNDIGLPAIGSHDLGK